MNDNKLGFQVEIGGEKCFTVLNRNNCSCYHDNDEVGYISISYQKYIQPDWTLTPLAVNLINIFIANNESIKEDFIGLNADETCKWKLSDLRMAHSDSTTNLFVVVLMGKEYSKNIYLDTRGMFGRNFIGVSGCIDKYETIRISY